MKASVRYKFLDKNAPEQERTFRILNDVSLPLFTKDEKPQKVTLFKANSTVKGIPVLAEIQSTEQSGIGKGVLIEDTEGIYIIPRDATTMLDESEGKTLAKDLIEGTKETVTGVTKGVTDTIKGFDTKKYTGFDPKQLLVLGIVAILTVKILK